MDLKHPFCFVALLFVLATNCAPAQVIPRGATMKPPVTPDPATGRKLALCIGINQYRESSGFPKLQFAVSDAEQMAAALHSCGFETVLMTDDQGEALRPSRKNIVQEIEKLSLKACDPGDTIVVSFDGHGADFGGQAGLIPSDYDTNSAPWPVTIVDLEEKLSPPFSNARSKLILLDCCRSALESPAFRLSAGFLQAIASSQNFVFLTACDKDQSSYEDEALRHGRFSYVINDGLNGKARWSDDEFLDIIGLFEYVSREFKSRHWVGKQNPRFWGSLNADSPIALRCWNNPATVASNAVAADPEAMSHCWQSFQHADYMASIKQGRNALTEPAHEAEARGVRALSYFYLGYLSNAVVEAQLATNLDSENAAACRALGLVAYAGKNYAEAIAKLEQAHQLMVAKPERWWGLVNNEADSFARLAQAVSLYHTDGKQDLALGLFESIATAPGTPNSEQAMARLYEGSIWFGLGQFDRAHELFSSVADGSPIGLSDELSDLARLNMGICAHAQKKFSSATNAYLGLLARQPAGNLRPKICFLLGNLYETASPLDSASYYATGFEALSSGPTAVAAQALRALLVRHEEEQTCEQQAAAATLIASNAVSLAVLSAASLLASNALAATHLDEEIERERRAYNGLLALESDIPDTMNALHDCVVSNRALAGLVASTDQVWQQATNYLGQDPSHAKLEAAVINYEVARQKWLDVPSSCSKQLGTFNETALEFRTNLDQSARLVAELDDSNRLFKLEMAACAGELQASFAITNQLAETSASLTAAEAAFPVAVTNLLLAARNASGVKLEPLLPELLPDTDWRQPANDLDQISSGFATSAGPDLIGAPGPWEENRLLPDGAGNPGDSGEIVETNAAAQELIAQLDKATRQVESVNAYFDLVWRIVNERTDDLRTAINHFPERVNLAGKTKAEMADNLTVMRQKLAGVRASVAVAKQGIDGLADEATAISHLTTQVNQSAEKIASLSPLQLF